MEKNKVTDSGLRGGPEDDERATRERDTESAKVYFIRGKEILALRKNIDNIKKEYMATNVSPTKAEVDEITEEKRALLQKKELEFQQLFPNQEIDERSVGEAQKYILESIPPDAISQ